jgi:hypothetical protein
MAILVLTFISMMLATLVLAVAMTRQSAEEKTVGQRMASIHISKKKDSLEAAQLLKATKTISWLDRILVHFQFGKTMQARILQANSSSRKRSTCWPALCVQAILSWERWKCWLRTHSNRPLLNSGKFSNS